MSLRAGQRARFEFVLNSATAGRYKVQPVNMQQLPSGLLLPADKQNQAGIRLISKTEIQVSAGQSSKIVGEVTAPPRNGVFLPMGVLVTQLPDREIAEPRGAGKRAGVTYVSRYLLRVEVRTPGATNGQHALKLTGAAVIPQKGLPALRAVVQNNAAGAVEFSIDGQLMQGKRVIGRPFKLSMPVRANEQSTRRHAARAMPGASVYMEAMLPGPVITGDYDLELAITWKGRRYSATRGKVHLDANDFPALHGQHAVLLDQLHILNPQIAFGAGAGGKRLAALKLENRGKTPVDIQLQMPADAWCYVRPAQITIPALSSRGILIGLKGPLPKLTAYQAIELTATATATGSSHSARKTLPVAWLPEPATGGKLKVEAVQWNAAASRLEIKLLNQGDCHQTPAVSMRLSLPDGSSKLLHAGFGGWVLPESAQALPFARQKLEPGVYHYEGEIESAGQKQTFAGEVVIGKQHNGG